MAFETAGCVGSDGGGLPRERAASEEERLRRRTLGLAAVEDQVAGVRWLQAQGLVEAGRASICGWSFGGFLAAMAVLRRPDAFRAAVAGAPVSRWEAYGCHYAERYLGDPIANRAGYEASALTPLVAEMPSDARLMIAHGMADENVHFRHSALLVDALRQAGKVAGRDYVLLPFPAERHNPKYLDDRAFLERRMFDFLEMNAGRRPPGGREAGAEGGREASEEEEADAEVRAPERGGESGAARERAVSGRSGDGSVQKEIHATETSGKTKRRSITDARHARLPSGSLARARAFLSERGKKWIIFSSPSPARLPSDDYCCAASVWSFFWSSWISLCSVSYTHLTLPTICSV